MEVSPLDSLRARVREHLGVDAVVDVDDAGVVIRRGDVELRLSGDDRWVLTQPVAGGMAVAVLDDFQTTAWAGIVRS